MNTPITPTPDQKADALFDLYVAAYEQHKSRTTGAFTYWASTTTGPQTEPEPISEEEAQRRADWLKEPHWVESWELGIDNIFERTEAL